MNKTAILLISLFFFSCMPKSDNSAPTETKQSNVYQGPIIDMHIHANSEESGKFFFGLEHPETLRGERYKGVNSAKEQMDETLKRFEIHNIVKAMVTNGDLWINDAPDKIIIGKSNLPADTLRALFQKGRMQVMAEMSPFYGGIKADDPSLDPYFDLAEELQIPVGFHIFPGGPPGGIYDLGLKGMRVANASPLQIEEVLVKRPDLKIYIMHGGWPYLDDMKALMYAHPQIYLDIAVIDWILTKEEFYNYLRELVDAGFGKRIMFGTDQMTWPQTIDIAVNTLNGADFLSWKQREDIFYNNAAHFLGLSEEEIAKHKSMKQNL
ncbi:MAG: amidohydrolase family protein [Flavobacteriaceae bacterium]